MECGLDWVPGELRAAWRAAGWYPGQPILELFEQHVEARPQRPAVVDDHAMVTYAELWAKAGRLASVLAGAGIGPGDVVAVQLSNRHESCVLDLAAAWVGALPLALPVADRTHELENLLSRSGARALMVEATFKGQDHAGLALAVREHCPDLADVLVIGEAPPGTVALDPVLAGEGPQAGHPPPRYDADPDGPARVIVTSGTEGEAKMILYSHHALSGGLGNMLADQGADGDLRLLCLPPLSSGMGAHTTWSALARFGGTLVLTSSFDPGGLLDLIERERPSHCVAVPAMLHALLARTDLEWRDTSSLRLMHVSGAASPEAVVRETRARLGCVYVNAWGCVDGALVQTAVDDPPAKVATTVGQPRKWISEIRIVGDDGVVCSAGQPGEIWARGPMSPMGYFRSPDLDDLYRTPDGWTRTGDMGLLDPDGYLRVVGRLKDIVIRGGVNISPVEVEGVLVDHPAVALAACVGIPDERLGERLCAVIVPAIGHPTPTLADVTGFLRERGLAVHKLPERLEVATELPLNPHGKVLRRELRERLAAEHEDAPGGGRCAP